MQANVIQVRIVLIIRPMLFGQVHTADGRAAYEGETIYPCHFQGFAGGDQT